MKRLTVKVLVVLVCSFFAINLISLAIMFYISLKTDSVRISFLPFSTLSATILALTFYAFAINKLIIKRVKVLSEASKRVAAGDYDIRLLEFGEDELSLLIKDFNIMTAELKANEYLSKDFIKNVSHEFKTPISSIKGYADLIGSGKLSKHEINEYADIISNQADRLYKLSTLMLKLSHVDSSNIIKKEDKYKVDEQIRNVLQLLQNQWEIKNINFELDLDEIEITNNSELTFQIWQNLISNAINFSFEDGTIKLRLYQKDNRLRFEITDNGIGIDPNDAQHVFKQFFTAEKSRTAKNTGLGLAIVKKIIDKLGGSITFSSQPRKETTFIVELIK